MLEERHNVLAALLGQVQHLDCAGVQAEPFLFGADSQQARKEPPVAWRNAACCCERVNVKGLSRLGPPAQVGESLRHIAGSQHIEFLPGLGEVGRLDRGGNGRHRYKRRPAPASHGQAEQVEPEGCGNARHEKHAPDVGIRLEGRLSRLGNVLDGREREAERGRRTDSEHDRQPWASDPCGSGNS